MGIRVCEDTGRATAKGTRAPPNPSLDATPPRVAVVGMSERNKVAGNSRLNAEARCYSNQSLE